MILVVRLVTANTSIPFAVVLVVVGLVYSELPGQNIQLNPDVVLVLVIPPLLYSAALKAGVLEIRANLGRIASLSVGLVLVTALESGAARLQTRAVWALGDFLLEGFVFLLIGEQFKVVIDGLGPYQTGTVAAAVGVTVAAVLVIRPLWLFVTRRLVESRGTGASTRELIALSWSGTRGVITLAAAFALPLEAHGTGFPDRDLLLLCANDWTGSRTRRSTGETKRRSRPSGGFGERCSTPSARSWCAGETAVASRTLVSAGPARA